MADKFWYAIGGFGAVNIFVGIIAYQIFSGSGSFGFKLYKWLFGIGFLVSVLVFLIFFIWG